MAVAEILFTPEADQAISALEADPTREQLLVRVDAALQALAADPGDQRCRRRSYGGGLWGMPVRTADDDWLILWVAGPQQDEITVVYVGPDL